MKRADAPTITQALIQWLDVKYEDKTITTEIPVNTSLGVKIADVVVSNGHSMAYEIKSALDTTVRLDAQVNGFIEMFEYVNLVYWSEKFEPAKLNLPENIGLIRAYWSENEIAFRVEKKAKINKFLTPEASAKFLWKKELRYFLRQKQIKFKMSDDKDTLVSKFAEFYKKRESVEIFRYVLKKRFELGYSMFKYSNDLNVFKNNKTDFNYKLQYS